jgi:hypothetical protein
MHGTYAECPSTLTTQFGEVFEAWMEPEYGYATYAIVCCLDGGAPVTVDTGIDAVYPLRLDEQNSVLAIEYTVAGPTTTRYESDDSGANWTMV